MIQTLQQTEHFTIQYDDRFPTALARAQDLLAIVEAEFVVLTGWFNIHAGFGVDNRVAVKVNGDIMGGFNRGYKENGESIIETSTYSHLGDASAAEAVKATFVAEFAEILMWFNNNPYWPWDIGYQFHRTGRPWDPIGSAGEGLSLLCAVERFPVGYAFFNDTTRSWLALPNRASINWVDHTMEWSGTAPPSGQEAAYRQANECALLFLYYLKTQCSLPIPTIIQAGGATLAATYENLTGLNDGFQRFTDLLECFFPAASPLPNIPDNPFPLLEPSQRTATLSVKHFSGPRSVLRSGEADVFLLGCGSNRYHYDIQRTNEELLFELNLHGFGIPVVEWFVNGVRIVPGTPAYVMAEVTPDDPALPAGSGPAVQSVKVANSVSSASYPVYSALRCGTEGVEGKVDFSVEARVSERYCTPSVAIVASRDTTLRATQVVFEDKLAEDAKECRNAWLSRIPRTMPVPFRSFVPDPTPDELSRTIRQLRRMSTLIELLGRSDKPEMAHELLQFSEARLGLSRDALKAIGSLPGSKGPAVGHPM